MGICESFNNLVAFATETVYLYKILSNDKELKLRSGRRISEDDEILLSYLKRMVDQYKLIEVVDFNDEEDD